MYGGRGAEDAASCCLGIAHRLCALLHSYAIARSSEESLKSCGGRSRKTEGPTFAKTSDCVPKFTLPSAARTCVFTAQSSYDPKSNSTPACTLLTCRAHRTRVLGLIRAKFPPCACSEPVTDLSNDHTHGASPGLPALYGCCISVATEPPPKLQSCATTWYATAPSTHGHTIVRWRLVERESISSWWWAECSFR